jgi:hypothetical protein
MRSPRTNTMHQHHTRLQAGSMPVLLHKNWLPCKMTNPECVLNPIRRLLK